MGTVYSTEHGRMCPDCEQPVASCSCVHATSGAIADGDGIVRVERSTKGRKGKAVTLVHGIALDPDGLRVLAREIKQKCGAGGAVKDGVIEVQGEHRDAVVRELEQRGYTVKRSGG